MLTYTSIIKPTFDNKFSPDDILIRLNWTHAHIRASPSPSHTHTHAHARMNTHAHVLRLPFSLFRHGTFRVYTALTWADYYSAAIKSQFGVGRLSGHLKGHGTRQIVGCIEMDDAVKVESASLVWKCACKNLGVATNLNRCPLQNIDARMNVSL